MRGGTIPYLPEALAKRNENRANWPAADPEAKCYMLGVPRATYHNFPFQIFQGDGDLLMVYPFAAANRIIYMKDHSELPVDSWMGKSNGTWEGDVLVVTTTAQNDQTWLDRAGNHHSNKLKVTERFTLLGPNHIWYEATLDDPLTYSRPWTIEMPLYRVIEENAQLLEHKCVPFTDMLLYHDLLQNEKEGVRRMHTRLMKIVASAGLLMAVVLPVSAHHSFSAEFDQNKQVTLEGTVVMMEWVNPHSWLHIDVKKPDGSVERWKIEGGSPSVLLRKGWNRDSLPVGTKIKVVGFQAKDGALRASSRDLQFPDGRRMDLGGTAPLR